MPQRNAYIAEQRKYDNPAKPTTSPYDVILPATSTDAVIEPTSGKAVTALLAGIKENKANATESILNQVKGAKNNDLFQSAIDGELGLLKINPAGAGEAATKNAPSGVGWGSCFAVQHGETRMLIAVDDRGRLWTNGWNAVDWAGWTPIATAEQSQLLPIPYASGITSSQGFRCKNQFGEVTLNPHFYAPIITNDMIIATLPVGFWPQYITEVPIVLITSGGTCEPGNMAIFTDGTIRVLRAGSQTASYGIANTITYLAQGG